MDRITNQHLEFELSRLNEVMGTPEETVSEVRESLPGKWYRHNVGNIHLYDNNIVQTKNESGGIAVLAYCRTKREAHTAIQGMSEAVRQFRLHRGI